MTLLALPGHDLLDRVLSGDSLLDSLHAAAELRGRVSGAALLDAYDRGDELARRLLLPAIALVPGRAAESLLLEALSVESTAGPAAWALGDRAPVAAAVDRLDALTASGGFDGMLADLTLERWTPATPGEPLALRSAGRRGLRIVQVYMQGFVDAGLNRAGAGDGGGLATLLVHLSAALAARPEVEHVTTLTRAFAGGTAYSAASEQVADGATIERLPFGGDGYLASGDMWAASPRARAWLEVALRRLAPSTRSTCASPTSRRSPPSASVRGSACPCTSRSLPIRTRSSGGARRAGRSTAESFVSADQREHLLFRARLVERLRDQARGLALLPRASGRAELEELVRLPADARRPPCPHRGRGHLDRIGRRGGARGADTAAAADLATGCRPLAKRGKVCR